MDPLQFLGDIAEINQIFTDTTDIATFLHKVAVMVGRHLHAGVCSIYLYDDESRELTLCANTGLNTNASGMVVLKNGEGLVGLALEELRPVRLTHGSSHPRFKAISGLNEEAFDAYCAVPILRGIVRIGVLVVQRDAGKPFTDGEVTALRVVTNQLAALMENARMLMTIEADPKPPAVGTQNLRGRYLDATPASAGFAHGPAIVDSGDAVSLDRFAEHAAVDKSTLADFEGALLTTETELITLQSRMEQRLADAGSMIFGAHLLLLKDAKFTGEMAAMIKTGTRCMQAVLDVTQRYIAIFERMDTELLREKRDDIRDLACRILRHLMPQTQQSGTATERHIVIARELLPSSLIRLAIDRVSGVVLVSGGVTSHAAILARSLSLPLMICDEPALLDLADGTMLLMDDQQGRIYISPDPQVVAPFLAREKSRAKRCSQPLPDPNPARTADGHAVTLLANINLLSDLDCALAMHADGVGLYRTEFPFMIRSSFPTEEEQYRIYRKLDHALAGKVATFRTLDIGGDKVLPYFRNFHEGNPFLGMRSIRFSLNRSDIFLEQLRAILRAGTSSQLRIMFPMIGSLEELLAARAMVDKALFSLELEGIPCNRKPAIGMMVELPSVLAQIDTFARSVDFFSIGTNDFIQYMLAVDRTNQKVASMYVPHHPAVLRGIAQITAAGLRAGIDVSVCGEMANSPRYLPFLLGCGIRTLSIDPTSLLEVKKAVSQIPQPDAIALCQEALRCDSVPELGRMFGVPA
ncbi:MAG: phosphoenolpyruvate--protein phosphotransferase [Chitinispirillaceae bacterium]|jgi:phosphotransferase system enzyme I (PtsP)|nr:phosphoenolpyruvate--protein phosphotransferase [Chitinispirillaceae bacterium]